MAYAHIDSIKWTSLAAEGDSVLIEATIVNQLLDGNVSVTVDCYKKAGGDFLFSKTMRPSWFYLPQNGSTKFDTFFVMPSYDVEFIVRSWAWYENYSPDGYPTGIWEWHQQESWGPVLVALSVPLPLPEPSPEVNTLDVKYYKMMATLSLPTVAFAGSVVRGSLIIENYEYDAEFTFGGLWKNLLGAEWGQGSVVFSPPGGGIKQGEVFYSEVSFTMPSYGVSVAVTIRRFNPSTGIPEILEQEGPLVVQRL